MTNTLREVMHVNLHAARAQLVKDSLRAKNI
jgi:hypothetical protein